MSRPLYNRREKTVPGALHGVRCCGDNPVRFRARLKSALSHGSPSGTEDGRVSAKIDLSTYSFRHSEEEWRGWARGFAGGRGRRLGAGGGAAAAGDRLDGQCGRALGADRAERGGEEHVAGAGRGEPSSE